MKRSAHHAERDGYVSSRRNDNQMSVNDVGQTMSDFLQLTGKRVVLFGMANRKSVAAHIGQVGRFH